MTDLPGPPPRTTLPLRRRAARPDLSRQTLNLPGTGPRTTLPVRRVRRLVPPPAPAPAALPAPINPWIDRRNVLIIVAAWLLLLILVPAQHDFPSLDDWIYLPTAYDTFQRGVFTMPGWSQTNLVGLIYWGVLWCKIFGFSVTTLTVSVLALYAGGMVAFYGIGRLADLTPGAALLATGLLGFNPIVVYLAYAYMTDVPFVALMMVACYCYMRGLREAGGWSSWPWLLVGGLISSWAYLMRQFAVLIPAGFVAYLVLEGLLTRKWRWRDVLLIGCIPLLVAGGWFLSTRDWQPGPVVGDAARRAAAIVGQPGWPRVFWLRYIIYLPFVAFFAWTAPALRRSRWWLVAAWLLVIVWSMYNLTLEPETTVQQVEPPFTAQIGPWALPLPQQTFTFGLVGSLFRLNGIDFEEYAYPQEKVWSEEAWRAIWVVGVVLGALLMAKLTSGLFDWLRAAWRRDWPVALSPVAGFYLVGLLVAVVSIGFTGDTFPRYALGYTPFVILFMVRGARRWGRGAWAYSVGALALLAIFAVLARADYADHMQARYTAALWMEPRTGAVRAGWNWNHWGHPDSDTYVISDLLPTNFRVEQRFPYTCRLCGFTTRYVLAEARFDMPPVPRDPLPGQPPARISPYWP